MYKASEVYVPFEVKSKLTLQLLTDCTRIKEEYGVQLLNPEIVRDGKIFLPRAVLEKYI